MQNSWIGCIQKEGFLVSFVIFDQFPTLETDNLVSFKYHVSCTDGKISVRINYYFTYLSTVVPSNSCVFLFPVGLFNTSCPSQEKEKTSKPTRPVENVVLTTNGLQEINIQMLDGTTVEKYVK